MATPEAGIVYMNNSGIFYGFHENYIFDYTYDYNLHQHTSRNDSPRSFDRTKVLNHSIPVSLLFGFQGKNISTAIETGVGYTTSKVESVGDYLYPEGGQGSTRTDMWVKPGVLVNAENNIQLSLFIDTNIYSKGNYNFNSSAGNQYEEKYDIKKQKFAIEMEFLKNFENLSLGFLLGFFDERDKLSYGGLGGGTIALTWKNGFNAGTGVSTWVTPTTLIGSDLLFSWFDSDLPFGLIPVGEYMSFSKVENNAIQWKTGMEQKVGHHYSVRFGYILLANFFNSKSSEEGYYYSSSGYKLIYNSVTAGFSREGERVRFDYLLRLNNLFNVFSPEVVNSFGVVVRL
jgi:hypothetical protein